MRELGVRIRFTTACLGNVRRECYARGRLRTHFLFSRSPDDRVMFLNTWWKAILKRAADILCKHQGEVKRIRFDVEVDGTPHPLEEAFEEVDGDKVPTVRGHFHRYYKADRFAKHEAFFPGTVIGLRCIVPQTISDDDFRRLLELAGKYCGISPACPNEYGFFTVESIQSTGRGKENKDEEVKEKEPTTS